MMRPGSLLRSLSLLLVLPRLAAAAPVPDVPNVSGSERDYLFPPKDLGQAAGILPGKSSGERVQYQAFDGTVYTLNRFLGRHVALLLPDSWLGEGKLTPERVGTFVDRSDLLYQSFQELIGQEPGPSDRLLTIAIVRTCGFGCGYVGAKGIEISPDAGSLSLIEPELAAGLAPGVVAHEMAHNFDLWNGRLGYWSDFAHAWTRFFDHYILIDDRQGTLEEGPGEVLRRLERETFGAYIADPSLSWGSCVRDGICAGRVDRNGAWAGTLWRLARLHGAQAVWRYARFLAGHAGPEPATPEEKNDLHVEAMAAGAAADLGCYVDAWRWQASPASRDRMAAAFGPGNPFCDDLDGDGQDRLSGDCDEGDAWRHLGAEELTNEVDDDCDGVVDDLTAEEPASGDFPDLQPVPFPGNVRGAISGWQDSDRFSLDLPSPRRVRIDLCSRPDFGGWVFFYQEDGSWLGYQYTPRGGCSTRAYDLDRAGEWLFSVELNADSQPGGYEVALYDAEPRPAVGGEGPRQGGFYTLAPCRMLDTRETADGPALVSGIERTVTLHGRCGVPPTARALAVNVTVIQPGGAGHLALYPAGSPPPLASSINFSPGRTRANNAILPLSADGAVALQAYVAGGGAVQVLVDVSGYFE